MNNEYLLERGVRYKCLRKGTLLYVRPGANIKVIFRNFSPNSLKEREYTVRKGSPSHFRLRTLFEKYSYTSKVGLHIISRQGICLSPDGEILRFSWTGELRKTMFGSVCLGLSISHIRP